MIEAKGVSKSFGPTLAVDDVSFHVRRGEVLGFLGPNGAGKSTTMRVITGFLPMSAGQVLVDGHDIEEEPITVKAMIGYLPENAPAYPEMSVEGFLGFAAELRGMKGEAKTEAVEKAIATCFLERVRYQAVDTLSKGYLHRTCFAQAILHDPPFLVLDEPTDGLDPNQKHEVRELIKRMGREKAIIVSTHILEEVEAICSRVLIIDRGKVVFNGTPDELKSRSAGRGTMTVRLSGCTAEEVKEAFAAVSGVSRVEITGPANGSVTCAVTGTMTPKAVGSAIRDKGWLCEELHSERGRLDEVFREITIPDTVEEGSK